MKRDLQSVVAADQLQQEADYLWQQFTTAPVFDEKSPAVIRKAFGDNFARGGTTERQWPPRKDPQAGGRSGWPGHPLLIDLGDLFGAIAERDRGHVEDVQPRAMLVGIDGGEIEYAAAQNFGYPPRNLPAREFVFVSEERLEELDELVADMLLESI